MEALRASYDDSSSDSDTSSPPKTKHSHNPSNSQKSDPLPPPPLALLDSPKSLAYYQSGEGSRVRSFAHVEGNYALHVFIPVLIPPMKRKDLVPFLKRVASLVPSLHVVDVDILLSNLCKDDEKLEQVALGRELHISLGRTVPIRVHQIGSIVTMLRQKLQSQQQSVFSIKHFNFMYWFRQHSVRECSSIFLLKKKLNNLVGPIVTHQ